MTSRLKLVDIIATLEQCQKDLKPIQDLLKNNALLEPEAHMLKDAMSNIHQLIQRFRAFKGLS